MKIQLIPSVIISVFLLSFTAHSQNNELITEVSVQNANITLFQENAITKINSNDAYSNVQFVHIGDLSTIQKEGVLVFSIPGRSGEITATATHVEAISSYDYKWYGSVDNGLGSVIFLNKKGKITGNISLPDQTYEIFSTDNDVELLVTANMETARKKQVCGNDSDFLKTDSASQANSAVSIEGEQQCLDFVRVLVLYTPRAAAAVTDINQTIDLCISEFATTIYNSAITSGAVIEFAGSQQLTFIETNNINNDLTNLTNNAAAQQARNAASADVVILLTDGNYIGVLGQAATIEPNNALSYAIVEADQATGSNEVFVHETGHLYGCRHENDTTGQPYAHGYIFKYATVMVQGGVSKTRIFNFSNPSVSVGGQSTGRTNTNDNARRLIETYPTVRIFRRFLHQFSATISGPTSGYAYRQYTWEALVKCGISPYTYEWRTSSDGINYSAVRGTSEFFSDYLTCPAGNNYYIRLDAGAFGQTSTAFITVYIDKSTCQQFVSGSQSDNTYLKENKNPSNLYLNAFPNPANNTVRIEFNLDKLQSVRLEILNAEGKLFETIITAKYVPGKYFKDVNTTNLPAGIYFYRLITDNDIKTKVLLIQK